MRSAIRLGLLLAAGAGAVGFVACNRHPVKIGPNGLPVFEGRNFRHPAGEPFYCFGLVTAADGKDHTLCREIPEWCAESMQRMKSQGNSIVSACKETDEVSCFDVGGATHCYTTADECTAFRSEKYGGTEYASACKTLARDFQPPP